MTSSKNIDEEELDYNQDEEDKNFCKFKESLDSMVNRRAKKYKNYSHPCLQKSNENLSYDDEMIEKFETTKENKSQETMTKEYRVIHRPPLPPSMKNQKSNQSTNDFQKRPSDFNYIIDNILSSNSNIKEYLRELRKNSELDYLLLSKILEKTLVQKSNALVQTDYNLFPVKTIRSVETNTNIPFMCQKQTQTRESRILSYKLLETENLFEKLKIQNNFNTNYEIKRTSDLKNEEESNIDEIETNFCLDCNQNHKVKNSNSIKIHDKFMNVGNQDKIQLWNNLLQIDNQSQTSDTSNVTSVAKYQQETASENQSTLSDDDQFSVSTRKSKKSLSSIKDDLLFERENDLLERYRRIKDYKIKYEAEKKEFVELRKQFKRLKKKFSDSENMKQQMKKTNDDEYFQKQNEKNLNKDNKKITFDEQKNHQSINMHKCDEKINSFNYETSIDDSEQETVIYDDNKDEDQSYLTDSEYSVLDDNKEQLKNEEEKVISNEKIAKLNSDLEDNKLNKLLNSNAVKTESKILIETTNLKRKEIAEILSKTELTNSGKISRRTQVTNVKKVPVFMSYENDNINIHYNTKTPEPIITSPPTTAATTPSATLQRKPKKKHKSNTIEIHSVTPSTSCSTRPTSAIDLDTISSKQINSNQSNVKFLANSYSEGELNSIKKDKNCLLNEQMNFGISEPFIAYDSKMYNEDDLDKSDFQKYYNTMPNDKGLKLILKKRSPSYNKKILENSNLQQIIEWQETNSSTITNEINSEPFKNSNDNLQTAKAVTLTTETTLQNNGKERTIETKSKAIRKYNTNETNNLDKENLNKKNSDENNLRSLSRASSNKTSNSKVKNCKNDKKYYENNQDYNPSVNSLNCNKCENCSQSEKKKKIYLAKEKNEQNLETKKNDSRKNKDLNGNENSVYVKNVNIDTSYDYLNLYPETLINPLMKYQKFSDPYLDDSFDQKYLSKDLINSNYGFIEKNKTNLDNVSKLSFDSGHSSSMSSTSYQLKIPNQNNQLIEKQNDFIDNVNDDNFVDNKYLSDKYLSDENINNLSLRPIEDSNFFLPDFHKNNLNRNTEIINRITKTVFPDTVKQKKIKKKKFVFEQQLNSPSNNEEQNDCKISSLITMEIPYYLRKKNKYPKNSFNQFYETSFNPDDDLTTKSSSCSSESDSLINEEDLNTLTKFQKFRPVLINKDDDQTTWEYSLECNCFNGVNASVKTTVTQFHQKNKPTFLDDLKKD